MRPALPLTLIVALAILQGCEPPQPLPPTPNSRGEPLPEFAARHRAWLHAERDSREGFEAAVEILTDLVARDVHDSFDLLNLTRAQLLVGDAVTPEIATELRGTLGAARATLGESSAPDVDYLLTLIAMRSGEPEAARESILRVTEARPDSTAAWYQLGRVCEDTGDLEGAAAAFATLLELAKDHRPGTYHHMLVLGRLGRSDGADALRARFESLPAEGQADPERCSFTEVGFRRAPSPADTAPIELEWRESRTSAPERSLSHWAGSGATVTLGGNSVQAIAWGALDPEGTRIGLAESDGTLREIRRDANGNPTLAESTIPCPDEVRDLRLADFDHDGDLDAIVLANTVALLRNDGAGAWTALPPLPDSPTGISASARCDFEDFDLGNDVDLAFPSESGIELYWNRRDHWEHESIHDPAGRNLFFAEDFDGDGRAEILGLGGAAGWTRTRFEADGNWAIQITLTGPSVRAAAIGDLDNDGDLDLVTSDDLATQWLRNDDGTFVVAGVIIAEPSRDLHCVDLDGDLRLEVVALGAAGVRVFRSSGAESNAAWVLTLDGRRDQRDGIGCVVEQVAGRVWQTRMVKEPGGLHLGLGASSRDSLDGIRLRWPAGIIQALPRDRFEVAKDGSASVRQKEGLVASCPFLFSRGENGWQFITDILGIAPLDEWRPPGAPELLDPQEHVRIAGDALAPVDGFLHLAITEELREITYLDSVELRAIDHPFGTVVHADESTTQGTIVPLRVLLVPETELSTPCRVHTERGGDSTETIRAQDGRFLHPEVSGPPQLAGWTPPQRLAFTPKDGARWLLLTGRVAWYDSTAVYALHQSGRGWATPRLFEIAADGTRSLIVSEVGLPAGLDRTALVELPAEISTGAIVELEVQHRLLLDRISCAPAMSLIEIPDGEGRVVLADGRSLEVTRAPLIGAVLSFHGYSTPIGDPALHEQTYDLERATIDAPWPTVTGRATRHGPVRHLIEEFDDNLVILLPADRVDLTFGSLPPAAEGMTRTWFLTVSGWAKEASFHGKSGTTIEPLPFRGMSTYSAGRSSSR